MSLGLGVGVFSGTFTYGREGLGSDGFWVVVGVAGSGVTCSGVTGIFVAMVI